MKQMVLLLLLSLLYLHVQALDNGLGKTPQMGWNSWNHFGCNIDENVIKGVADVLVSSGLKDLGYVYVNIDDCWSEKERTDGHIIPHKQKFASGMKDLGDYIHEKGLKFGIYSSAGTMTCAQYPASLYNEKVDAADFASWGVDYLKYDNCFNDGLDNIQRYTWMRDALNVTGRPIFYSLCNWGEQDVYLWGNVTGNSWRTTGDISDNWQSMIDNFKKSAQHPESAGPGGWNDPDMLEVGNGGMTYDEYQTHFALWSITKSPLILGNDLSKLDDSVMSIIGNEEVIEVNQDSLGIQGSLRDTFSTDGEIYTVALANHDVSIVVVNFNNQEVSNIQLDFKKLGLHTQRDYKIRDLWAKKNIGNYQDFYTIEKLAAHASVFYRFHAN